DWSTPAVVEATGDVGAGLALCLDMRGDPHVAYINTTGTKSVLYARKNPVWGWTKETVEAISTVADDDLGIAMHPDQQPAVVYRLRTLEPEDHYIYAKRGDNGWASEEVAAVPGAQGHTGSPSVAVGDDGIAYVAYANEDPDYLVLAAKRAGGWQFEEFDEEVNSGWGSSIVVDLQGRPRIGHYLYDSTVGVPQQGRLRYTSSAVEV